MRLQRTRNRQEQKLIQRAPRAPPERFLSGKLLPTGCQQGSQGAPKMSPTDPKTSKLRPQGSQNGAPEPSGLPKWSLEELQKPKNEATVQANNTPNLQNSLRIRNLLILAQVFTNIATAIIKLCDPLLSMFASTLLRPPIFSVKVSACPFL